MSLVQHNEVRPKYKKPFSDEPKQTHSNKRFDRDNRPSKINRAARNQQPPMHPDRQMAIRRGHKVTDHIDEITGSLCYTGISSDDPIGKIQSPKIIQKSKALTVWVLRMIQQYPWARSTHSNIA
jgi:hypothetical protein